jgi:uncharacterized glyoxalase superfamily protein PhnB
MAIIGTRHVLAIKDLSKSSDYYKNKLGFKAVWETEDWHFLRHGEFKIMLGECPNEKDAFETGDHSYVAYVEVTDVDELFHNYKMKGVEMPSEIEDKPWGQREFSVRTIDGHRMTFGEAISNMKRGTT